MLILTQEEIEILVLKINKGEINWKEVPREVKRMREQQRESERNND